MATVQSISKSVGRAVGAVRGAEVRGLWRRVLRYTKKVRSVLKQEE